MNATTTSHIGPAAAVEDPARAQSLAARLQMTRLPVCPKLRPTAMKWYAVDGYCVVDGFPERLMIPALDTFRSYCTTAQFCRCPWYRIS